MFCTTIIPTIGRQTLTRAVNSVLSQSLADEDFEIIVVNDSGKPLPAEDWQTSTRISIINTNRRERSVARNSGAAIAKGRYLHFLDDDDWLAPDALQQLWNLSQGSDAAWLYGITQLVDRQQRPLIRLRHRLNGNCFIQVMAGEWIPLQSSLIDCHIFFEVGGFNPLISGPEDIDLLRRIALVSKLIETPELIAYVVRGNEGSTTDYDHYAQASRWAREQIIEKPGVFEAMRTSAYNPFWQGRMFRIYLTSMAWNLHNQRLITAINRGVFAILVLIVKVSGLFSKAFWTAATRHYDSETFKKGFAEAATG